jgi:outer membrane protein assembly factor BamB
VYAFRPSDGHVLWSYQTTNYILSSPIIGGSATSTGGQAQAILFIGSTDKTLYAISSIRQGSGTQVNHPPTVSAGRLPPTPWQVKPSSPSTVPARIRMVMPCV